MFSFTLTRRYFESQHNVTSACWQDLMVAYHLFGERNVMIRYWMGHRGLSGQAIERNEEESEIFGNLFTFIFKYLKLCWCLW